MDNKEFMNNCKSVAEEILSCWSNGVNCYETTGKKQFCLESSHSWGTAYCNWSGYRYELFEALRKAGAINISGKVQWNHVRIYFNKRKRPIRE